MNSMVKMIYLDPSLMKKADEVKVTPVDTRGKITDGSAAADAETKRQLAMIDQQKKKAAEDRIRRMEETVKSLEESLKNGAPGMDLEAIRGKITDQKVLIATTRAFMKGEDPVPK
jgi:hypothetical protein